MYKMRYGLFEGLFYKEMHRLKKKKKKSIGKKIPVGNFISFTKDL